MDNSRFTHRSISTGIGAAVLVLAPLALVGPLATASSTATSAALSTVNAQETGVAQRGRVDAQRVKARQYSQAPRPTKAQRKILRTDGPMAAPTTAVARTTPTAAMGPGTSPPAAKKNTSLVATDFALLRNQRLPAGGSRSAVNEPSSTEAGNHIMAVGNWYSAYSHDRGTTYTYLNPFTIFGSGFCCDQVVTYDISHDRQFWLLQYNNRLVLANSRSLNMGPTWCSYALTPQMMGQTAGAWFDFNKIAVSTNNVYVTSNVYSAGGSFITNMVFRLPIDAMSRCVSTGFQFVARSTEFSPAFAQGAGDTMYWGTNWPTNVAMGSTFRIIRWPDSSNSYTVYDRAIAAFTPMFVNQGKCGSANGVVLNWCQRSDSRMSGHGYLAAAGSKNNDDAILGWAFNARQDGSHPFPYIRRVYFRTTGLAYVGSSEFFGTWAAHLYPAMAADYRGHVGMAFAWGGGTGTGAYYPGSGVVLDDDINPNQPWKYSFYQHGAGNPCLNSDGTRRWGDYLDIHPSYPAQNTFQATGFAMSSHAGSCGSAANVSVANITYGRYRDIIAYQRFR